MNNPLTLSLARATYQDQDPTLLTCPDRFPTVAALRTHLIDRILIIAYPDDQQRAHATRWLAWIAHHLGSDQGLPWWRIPSWIPRWQLRLAVGLTGGLACGIVVGLAGGFAFGLAGRLAAGLWNGLGLGLQSKIGKEPRVITPRWPRLGELLEVIALVLGLANGLVGGLLHLWTVPLPRAATATPDTTYRMDHRRGTIIGLTGGLAAGIVGGLTFGLAGGLAVGLASGLAGGLVGVLVDSSARMVRLTQLILMITGTGRVNLIGLLEDAHQRQVLRQAGAVYQFRHAELHEHLAKIHHQCTRPPTNT